LNVTSSFLIACVLALGTTVACDAPWAGPTLPAGGHWVTFSTLSCEGPMVVASGILAATSTEELEAAVVAFETSRHAGYRLGQACPTPCWRLVRPDDSGLLYLAVATLSTGCATTVKEGTAIAGRLLYLIHWVSSPSETRCDAAQASRWRLLAVSRRELPGAGTFTVRLQLQGSSPNSNAAESHVQLT
jgi:hypothetical protein